MALDLPTLTTTRLHLRPFTPDDADPLFALMSDAHVLRYWDSPPWTDPARADRFVDASASMAEGEDGVRLAVDDADGFVGWIVLGGWNPTYRSASLGFVLASRTWGRGYATEAAGALLTWGFDVLPLNRVQAEADTRNAPCARVLEKLGFRLEGTLREDCVVDGVVSDSWVFGLLRREWTPPAT